MAGKKDIIADATREIIRLLPGSTDERLKTFTAQFYAKLPPTDAANLNFDKAALVAAESFAFITARTQGAPKIRVFTPDKKAYGWKTGRTVIEIVNDDMPFLVDSVTAELSRQNLRIVEMLHPIIHVTRDGSGTLLAMAQSKEAGASESLIHIEIAPLPEDVPPEKLVADLARVLAAVRFSVMDWRKLMDKAEERMGKLAQTPPGFREDEAAEVRDFMQWLVDKNFIFLGYIEYNFFDAKGKQSLSTVEGSELGIFKLDDFELKPKGLEALPPEMLHFALLPQLIEITKSGQKSLVHRPVHMDYVGLKRFDKSGKVVGEARFLGLFTSTVYYQTTDTIPIIRRKIKRTLERANFDPASHDGKALKAILEFYPRDELFQITEDDLFDFSLGLLALEARPRVKLFVRKDIFERFLSCMVYIPRERFSTYYREQIQRTLELAFGGTVTAYYTQMTDSPLARVQIIVKTTPGQLPQPNLEEVELRIAEIINLWSDSLWEQLSNKYDEKTTERLFKEYSAAFPKTYINLYNAESAVHDIDKIEQSLELNSLTLELFHHKADGENRVRLKTFNPNQQIPLSDILPMLENAGFRVLEENPFTLTLPSSKQMWMREFQLTTTIPVHHLNHIKPLFEQALTQTWSGEMENDGFNALTAHAALTWREVTLLRAYGKYLKQIGFAYSQPAIEQALSSHPQIAANLVALFDARFNPLRTDAKKCEQIMADIDAALGAVTNLVEDRIIRRYAALINATLRTNYYQPGADKAPKTYISFKLDSGAVPELPLPKPHAEIFVYSTRVEGIHLRGGKVARGGLRWSDRREDFRTEVLGLMKAQMVKNAVIVPVGSKGGFVLKNAPPASNREAFMAEGIECYKLYLRGLLDITDNIINGIVVPPPHVIRYDGDDPYLVVAADKGTASFSDYANSVSKEYNFWLGDAFASGGSAGYDHKKMAITARGGWVSVTRHFHEMGVDIAKSDFTTIGIGDMSGDVFGNGMILSDHIKLVAAFNHLHIFLDPSPDPKKSFEERKRLFYLSRSGWNDYNAKLISKGGGIFERSAKSIAISKEAQMSLGITAATLSPDELIRAILMAPVDLFWNGGIGTYVKAEDETHEQVGDRTNNAVRVNGRDLRCKIVGEGGNLGFTQKGRIEYARAGGRLNTDAIDNSGGVDCSDHEVNIKIAFGSALASGKLTLEKRDSLLTQMTDEVASLVLFDNQYQTQAITLTQLQGSILLEAQASLMRRLERAGLLDRGIEFLPSDKAIAELQSKRQGLTRPEIAVLLAYSKMSLYRHLLDSTLPDDPYFSNDLLRYFPTPMQQQFAAEIETHPLRREIIATVVTNSLINRTGITFLQQIADDTGMRPADVARAYTLARDTFNLRNLWEDIEVAGATITAATKVEMITDINRFLARVTMWFLRNVAEPIDMQKTTIELASGIREFTEKLHGMFSAAMEKAYTKRLTHYEAQKAPAALAKAMAELEALSSACDVVRVAAQSQLSIETVGKLYFELGGRLKLGWLRLAASATPTQSHWDTQAATSIINDLYDLQRRLTARVIEALCDDTSCAHSVEAWIARNPDIIARYDRFIQDLRTHESLTFPMLVMALRQVEAISVV